MKQDFKKWLTLHKGKSLTPQMIELIATKHEDEIGNTLYNEGLCFESIDTGKNIMFGDCEQDSKEWSVQNIWKTEREFKTLRGAIKYATK